MITVVLIGAGNVATHLYKAFSASEKVSVTQWFNRHRETLESYKNEVEIIDDFSNIKEADVYIIAVSDDAISKVSRKLPFKNRLVVHTSGSVIMHDLDKKHRRGVFYPLQTFSKSADIDFLDVPICLEVLDKKDYPLIKTLARAISNNVKRINSDQRAALHLGAVFVNNFTNQLYRVAHEITESQGAEFDLLKPLITETAKKVQNLSPYQAQTGPALRNDKKTIKNHLELIEKSSHKEIYELLTKSIKKTHGR
ncbi:Rossmann-like and DUF2520 domain-containing protein [Sediminibacter sp. Hel_I_10]|uniref:Rossmann-like and DUF2520 domain-containing protein n=1 Tax=Sediminibacter sp. Hel_I_10 TaxID=1392490 RepID=UPI00047BBB99|nr:Rossmann-like and DUF2520 domain-containing protein [Sediminibacter sp. Hel_I_10]